MKKLLLICILFLTVVLLNPFNLFNYVVNDIGKLTNKEDFNKMMNKRYYLIKSIALDPKKMDRKTYNTLYDVLNYETTAKNKILSYFK